MTSLSLAYYQAVSSTPGDCILTGLCGLVTTERPVAPGLFFVAAGLIMGGIWGLRRFRNN